MHHLSPMLILSLALSHVSATPLRTPSTTSHIKARAPLTGYNTGSLYSMEPETSPLSRLAFWQSGSCGLSTYFTHLNIQADANLVAMPDIVMANHGASQHNELCGKKVILTETFTGKVVEAYVADTNRSPEHSIDMTMKAWNEGFGRPVADSDNTGVDPKSPDAKTAPKVQFKLDWSIEM